MAAAAELYLMTVDQYRQLPVLDDVTQELHWGQVITMVRPRMGHAKLQSQLVRLLRPKAERFGVVESEVAFRALPEYDLRSADVAFVSQQRWDSTPDDDNLHGSPELVIEILSPSNSKAEMRQKATLYLSTGAHQFWLVDPAESCVTVTDGQHASITYLQGQHVPLPMVQSSLDVAELFSVLNGPSSPN